MSFKVYMYNESYGLSNVNINHKCNFHVTVIWFWLLITKKLKTLKTELIRAAYLTWIIFHLVNTDFKFFLIISFQVHVPLKIHRCFEKKIYVVYNLHACHLLNNKHWQCPSYWTVYSGRHCGMSISHVHPGVYSLSNITMEGHSDSESNTAKKKKKGRLHGVTQYCAHKVGSYIW